VTAESVVVAVGRIPNTDGLGLDRIGIALSDGYVVVDDAGRAAPHLAAVGDVVPGPALAHRAAAQAIVAADALCGLPAAFDARVIPAVVFSDPEIITVGMTLDQARAEGIEATESSFPMRGSARAHLLGDTTGAATLVVDTSDGRIVGVHAAGPHVSELAAEAAVAIEFGATAADLALTIHPHPTVSETLAGAAQAVDDLVLAGSR
jgi:dihydrolipoamide dehydrogenase